MQKGEHSTPRYSSSSVFRHHVWQRQMQRLAHINHSPREEKKPPPLPAKTTNTKCMFSQGLFKEIALVGRMSHGPAGFTHCSYSE